MFGLAQTLLTFDRRVDFFLRCFLRLFDKAVKKHHVFVVGAEENPRDAAIF